MFWLSGLNFMEVSVRPQNTIMTSFYHCVSKLAYFGEHDIGLVFKSQSSRMSGSNFMDGGGPPQCYNEIKRPTLIGLRVITVYRSLSCNVSVNSNWVHPPGNSQEIAQKNCPEGRNLTFESCLGPGNLTRAGISWKLKVKRFVRVLVFLAINTGSPKNC